MSPVNKIKNIFKSVFYFDSFGFIANAMFLICVISGVILAIPYDINTPLASVSKMLLLNPAASFVRNIHYWSAQLFLIYSVLHIWEHFKRGTEKEVRNGVWLRLVISIAFLFFVMISGFLLKADVDSIQARNIIYSLLESIPFIGESITYLFIGPEGDYQLLYVHHIATATIFLTIIIIEHAKTLWSLYSTFIYSLIFTFILSLLITPSLHDGLNPVVKGPWYLVGLQEVLHWFSNPVYMVLFIFLFFIGFYYIKKLSENKSKIVKKGILISFFFYVFLTIFAFFFRGEYWEFYWPWNNKALNDYKIELLSFSEDLPDSIRNKSDIRLIFDRNESCIVCHDNVKGFSPSHNPNNIGCFSCHRGNPYTMNKSDAHSDMILIPGNLSDASETCGNSACHPDIIPRVNNSIMVTLSGMVSVNRYTFGEVKLPEGHFHIKQIKNSAADTHLKNLCASCHIGNEKQEFGLINQLSRGGGCNACHLNYTEDSKSELKGYLADKEKNGINKFHPSISIDVSKDHCFGCHSRSGRISTSYEGWHETQLDSSNIKDFNNLKLLEDGRVFRFVGSDVHHSYELDCIDCHNSYEVMGDGESHQHKEEQVKILCEDCHPKRNFQTISKDELDYESSKIIELKDKFKSTNKFIKSEKSGFALINTYIDSSGDFWLKTKNSGKILKLSKQNKNCSGNEVHKNLSCNSCHTPWVSQCIGCHTEYDPNEDGFDNLDNKEVRGSWVENIGEFLVDPPVLGVKLLSDNDSSKVIDTFVPGMVLTIDESKFNGNTKNKFKRLYAPISAHTTIKNSRTCKSCHNEPLAIGCGRGELKYNIKDNVGVWQFIPKYVNRNEDNLPEDAWIGFLEDSEENRTTRTMMRPFNLDEQKRILTVASCLVCHNENSKIMIQSLTNFKKMKSSLSKKCILPTWNK